jgi:heme-degrading monooxygenase HmoA
VQISAKVTNDVLPSLQEQPGFVDFFALSNRTNAERLVCNGFWTSREDAEECHRQHLETITNMLQPVLESPRLKTFAEGVRQQCIALPEPPRGGRYQVSPQCRSV